MTDALLTLIVILLVVLIWRQHRQHEELIRWIDSLAEMVGEAIDKAKGTNDEN